MKQITLTICVCTVVSRVKEDLPKIITELDRQSQFKPVQIIYLGDNKISNIGEKRNDLIRLAKGKYILFVDDDDRINPKFVDLILNACYQNPDCIVFDVMYQSNDVAPTLVKYGREFTHSFVDGIYYRKPNHLMAFKTELVKKVMFPEIDFNEDDQFAANIEKHILRQYRINDVLYYYDHDYYKTETRDRKKR